MVLRFGHSFEELAWAIIFILLPFACVYYPLDTLPEIMQFLPKILPTAHIFESMRSIIIYKEMISKSLGFKILFLNLFYFSISIIFFLKMIEVSREKGYINESGE